MVTSKKNDAVEGNDHVVAPIHKLVHGDVNGHTVQHNRPAATIVATVAAEHENVRALGGAF